jgi:NAD(P)-dependent dehydrogenase (short-subunit alcohol dehydrogenase family)
MQTVQGKVAVVTGASSGIGAAIAARLARAGAIVVLTGRDAARLEAVRQHCGGTAWSHAAEVTDEAQVADLARAVHARHGAIDILVNNAGVVMSGLLVDVEPADWRRLFEVNVLGVVHGCRHFLPRMIEKKHGGHVVNMASAAGLVGMYGMSTYSASKFALAGLTESLRFEMKRHGIGVSLVCPSYVDTPLAEKVKVVGALDNPRTRSGIEREFRKNSVKPELVAERTLQAILKNAAVTTVGRDAALARWMKRISPALLEKALSR